MADFGAGYISGAIGIVVGNPFDVIKVRLQSRSNSSIGSQVSGSAASFESLGALVRGTAAPILGYGALNSLLFVTYNRTMELLHDYPAKPSSLLNVWTAGAVGGLACFIVSAPTELVKCRAQVGDGSQSSWTIAKDLWKTSGVRGLYFGGVVTSVRDSVGYGFYFWSYEATKSLIANSLNNNELLVPLTAGGIAGCATWASIYPLDVIKTRVQVQGVTQELRSTASIINYSNLPSSNNHLAPTKQGAWEHTKLMYRECGMRPFFNGFWWCMGRAFVVNAVQWAAYEYLMNLWRTESHQSLSD